MPPHKPRESFPWALQRVLKRYRARSVPATLIAIALLVIATLLLPAQAIEPAAETLTAPSPSIRNPQSTIRNSPHDLRLLGVASCSAQACHGDIHRDDAFPEIWGNEHTVWVQDDPHAKAYLLLYGQASLDMAARLGLDKPYQAQECLTCHAPGGRTNPRTAAFEPSDAVGCETCHGPAERWIGPHTERSWRERTPEQKAALGFRNTQDAVVRAALCADCHVGSPQGTAGPRRDVNHDLIAAGHPRLQFELTAYLGRLRKHWSEKAEDPERPEFDPAFQTRLWAVGQATSAQAATALLAERADLAPQPWPEFAEFDCYACHHQLRGENWRQSASYLATERRTRPGSMPWGTWNIAMLGPLEQMAPTLRVAGPPVIEVAELQTMMETRGTPRDQIHSKAAATAERLDRWADELNRADYPLTGSRDLMRAMLPAEDVMTTWSWDAAVQHYLALRTLELTHRQSVTTDEKAQSAKDERITAALQEIAKLLAFPPTTGAVQYNSPRDYDPAKLREHVNELRELLTRER